MRKFSLIALFVLSVAGVLLFSTRLMAGRVVVDYIDITQEQGCSNIEVVFNFPVQYIKHFPYESGQDLRVQLATTVAGVQERDALFSYESVQIPHSYVGELVDISYEGNVDGGPYLTFYFDATVNFKVAQGKNYRSLLIAVSSAGSSLPCEITY